MQVLHNNSHVYASSAVALIGRGVPADKVVSAFKQEATKKVTSALNGVRDRIASPCAGKLIAYTVKAEVASNPDAASDEAIALLTQEAAARGMAIEDLFSLIAEKHEAFRIMALTIEALEATAKANIAALAVEASAIEASLAVIVSDTKARASEALSAFEASSIVG